MIDAQQRNELYGIARSHKYAHHFSLRQNQNLTDETIKEFEDEVRENPNGIIRQYHILHRARSNAGITLIGNPLLWWFAGILIKALIEWLIDRYTTQRREARD